MEKQLGVIFDMDGVLVDSEDAMKTASIESLKRFGINPVKEDFIEFTGMGENIFIGGVAGKYGLLYNTEMKEYAYKIYVEKARDLVFVYPGAKETIAMVKRAGCKIAIASAADLIKVKTNLACIGADESLFDAFVTGSDVEKKKPDPETFIKAARHMGVFPENCIVLEDAKSGIAAAKAAKMQCIGITTAFSYEELALTDVDYIIDDIQKASNIILKWIETKSLK